MTMEILPQSDEQLVRARQFIRVLLAAVVGFGLLDVAIAIRFGDSGILAAGIIMLGYSIWLLMPLHMVRKQRLCEANLMISFGLLTVLPLLALVMPRLALGLAVASLVTVALVLPFLSRLAMTRFLIVVWISASATILIGEAGQNARLPQSLADLLNVSVILSVLGLVMILLWQFSNRLMAALSEAHSSRTELEAAQAELRAGAKKYRQIVENAHEGICLIAPAGNLTFVNPRMLNILGYGEESESSGLLNSSIYDFIHPDDARLVQADADSRRAGETSQYEIRLRHPSGSETWALASATPLFNEAGQYEGTLAMVTDITARRQAESELMGLERKLQHTQKLESLGALAGGIAHDFNNLLMAIRGHASLALMDLPPDSPARESLDQIDMASQRAADLARQMLAYAGKGQLQTSRVNLNELLREMSGLIAISIGRDIELHYNLDESISEVEADADQLRQLIMNLVINASEVIDDKAGQIDIRTGAIEAERQYLAQSYFDDNLPAGRYTFLEVGDSGPGMDSDTRARIFDPFFSTKFSGRGLGLAAVAGITRSHKGTLNVESEPGTGSTFRLLLPSQSVAADQAQPVSSDSSVTDGGLILVADDEEPVRLVAARMLERLGFEVLTARDGQEAVEMYRERSDEIRAALLDLTMPRLTGAQALRQIRKQNAGLPILLMSGYNQQDVGLSAEETPTAFLQKPFTPSELATRLRAALARDQSDEVR